MTSQIKPIRFHYSSGRSSDRGGRSLEESGTSEWASEQTGCVSEIPADCLRTTASGSERKDYDWCEAGLTVSWSFERESCASYCRQRERETNWVKRLCKWGLYFMQRHSLFLTSLVHLLEPTSCCVWPSWLCSSASWPARSLWMCFRTE